MSHVFLKIILTKTEFLGQNEVSRNCKILHAPETLRKVAIGYSRTALMNWNGHKSS